MSDEKIILWKTSNPVPFSSWHVTLQARNPQLHSIAEASSLAVEVLYPLYLYMPCKRNFSGAVWKRCWHRNLQHQLMLSHPNQPIKFTRRQQSLLGKFWMPENGSCFKCRVWGVDAEPRAQDILQVHTVSGSKRHMTTLWPVHTAVFSVRQWQLKCHGW